MYEIYKKMMSVALLTGTATASLAGAEGTDSNSSENLVKSLVNELDGEATSEPDAAVLDKADADDDVTAKVEEQDVDSVDSKDPGSGGENPALVNTKDEEKGEETEEPEREVLDDPEDNPEHTGAKTVGLQTETSDANAAEINAKPVRGDPMSAG